MTKSNRDTTGVRVSLETKRKIEAMSEVLGISQQKIVELAVARIEGKIEIKIKDDAKAGDDPGHFRTPVRGGIGGIHGLGSRK